MQWQCNDNAMTMQWQCNGNAMKMQWQSNGNAKTTQWQSNGNAIADFQIFPLKNRCQRCMEMQWQWYAMTMQLWPLKNRCRRCQFWSMFIVRSSKISIRNTAVGTVGIDHCTILNTSLQNFSFKYCCQRCQYCIVNWKYHYFRFHHLRTAVSAVSIPNLLRQILPNIPIE